MSFVRTPLLRYKEDYMLTYATWHEPTLNFQVDETYKAALEVLQWSYAEYGEDIVYACSFGIEGIVLIDLISKVKPNAKIIFLDTDVHFKETYETIDKVKDKYPQLNIIMQNQHLHSNNKQLNLVMNYGSLIQINAAIFARLCRYMKR